MSLWKYAGLYLLGYAGAVIAVGVVVSVVGGSVGAGIVAPMIAPIPAAVIFGRSERREPTRRERTRLTACFVAMVLGVQVLMFAVYLGADADRADVLADAVRDPRGLTVLVVGIVLPVILTWGIVRTVPRMAIGRGRRGAR